VQRTRVETIAQPRVTAQRSPAILPKHHWLRDPLFQIQINDYIKWISQILLHHKTQTAVFVAARQQSPKKLVLNIANLNGEIAIATIKL
jgi:hypothetical protein